MELKGRNEKGKGNGDGKQSNHHFARRNKDPYPVGYIRFSKIIKAIRKTVANINHHDIPSSSNLV